VFVLLILPFEVYIVY